MKFFLRFTEPSSFAPLMGLFTAIGFQVPDGIFQSGSFIMAGIAGIIGFFMKEKK